LETDQTAVFVRWHGAGYQVSSPGLTHNQRWAGGPRQFFCRTSARPRSPTKLSTINFIVSFGAIAVLFALIFKYVPDATIAWKEVWEGAIATAFFFTIGKFLIGLYLGRAGVGSAYGAAGSIIVVIVWIYYSSMIFFFGAELTHVLARPKQS
jgi:YihY family inner membrane protein